MPRKSQIEDTSLPINHRLVRPYSQRSKQAIENWRLKHREKYLELSRKHNKDYYNRNKVIIRAKEREAYHQHKQSDSS